MFCTHTFSLLSFSFVTTSTVAPSISHNGNAIHGVIKPDEHGKLVPPFFETSEWAHKFMRDKGRGSIDWLVTAHNTQAT